MSPKYLGMSDFPQKGAVEALAYGLYYERCSFRLLRDPLFMRSNSLLCQGFPCGSDGKESACNEGDLGSVPGLGRSPGGGPGNRLQYSCLEDRHGQRRLVGCSPWDHKEFDMTE